jgi:hypothetical protein
MHHMKSYQGAEMYLGMVRELYRDIAQCYGVTKRQQRIEIRVIEDRFAAEGLSFLTKALPKLGKAVDKALSSGTALTVVGWKSDGSIPKFLGWLLKRVFTAGGLEVDHPDPIALKHFRQLVYLLYKLEIPYEPKTAQAVVDSFVQTEIDLGLVDWDRSLANDWIDSASDIVTRTVSALDPFGIQPKHGPGAVATGEKVCEKSNFKRIYSKLERFYPFMEWNRFSLTHVADQWREDQQLSVLEKATAKVVLVPKDSRGPRLISCEPLEIQWIQQGLGTLIRERIETSRWTRGRVNFADQECNRGFSLLSSAGGRWVTLDMKEASDRVSCKLVERLFAGHPLLLQAMMACRSDQTRLPDGTILTLQKFAPMGSNLCFPVESLCFYALAVSAIKHAGYSWRQALSSVYVYGDDLIVRDQVYMTLLQRFPTVGLKFNEDKCCTARFFRESCGCDAYKGIDITPIKLKTVWSHRRTDPNALQSYVALRNAMYGLGHYSTASYVQQIVEQVYGKIPFTNRWKRSDNGAFVSCADAIAYVCEEPAVRLNKTLPRRYDPDWQYSMVRTYGTEPLKARTRMDGWSELLRRFSDGYGSHGGVYAITRRNRLKRVWMVNS